MRCFFQSVGSVCSSRLASACATRESSNSVFGACEGFGFESDLPFSSAELAEYLPWMCSVTHRVRTAAPGTIFVMFNARGVNLPHYRWLADLFANANRTSVHKEVERELGEEAAWNVTATQRSDLFRRLITEFRALTDGPALISCCQNAGVVHDALASAFVGIEPIQIQLLDAYRVTPQSVQASSLRASAVDMLTDDDDGRYDDETEIAVPKPMGDA